jgi:hypothetical protein
MKKESTEHWTEDEELLLRYVLGRVAPAARTPLDAHILTCDRCRQTLERERLLAAGVRRLGRDRLKDSLAETIRVRPALIYPWPRILAAAAVIVVAGGIALYARWTALERERPEPTTAKIDSSRGTGSMTTEAPALELPEHRPARSSRKQDQPAEPEKEGKKEMMARQDHVEGKGEEGRGGTGDATAAVPAVTGNDQEQPAGVDEWWTGEHVLLGGPGDSLMSDVNPSVGMEKSAPVEQRSHDAKTAQDILLDQLPLSDLPAVVRKSQTTGGAGAVPIHVGRRGGSLHLTLYVSPMFSASELQRATVRRISDDSLLISVGDAVISVRAPGGTGAPAALQRTRRR